MIDAVKDNSEALVRLCEQYNVKRLELFGSALTEEDFDPETSDIDFLVEFLPLEPGRHARCYLGLLEKLQDMFGCNVDLVEVKAINNPYLMESINKDRREVYAA
ncbi:MAG: nucleotidyltransferase family protein [Planctomycetota bacterium]|jgi:predicted nucleotidyltransferase